MAARLFIPRGREFETYFIFFTWESPFLQLILSFLFSSSCCNTVLSSCFALLYAYYRTKHDHCPRTRIFASIILKLRVRLLLLILCFAFLFPFFLLLLLAYHVSCLLTHVSIVFVLQQTSTSLCNLPVWAEQTQGMQGKRTFPLCLFTLCLCIYTRFLDVFSFTYYKYLSIAGVLHTVSDARK